MKTPTMVWLAVAVATMMVFMHDIPGTTAATCNYMELVSCADAISSSNPPSGACCSKIKEQRPCFCQYLQDPKLRQYVSLATAQRIASQCGVTLPQC
ncbi:hypothetical protein QVD17_06448 [Tagetes erecta]|uniref:Bifunctional inhibitor/plant lipid transfer protein/seed storage helical domain-containing protein n=1 Tax=Tagetes erecta TaxID=13708 RepID=A0AAD8LGX9_TARER|nr:hypothetical protein QVD17_06448 [Tagetes erecta]